MPVCVSPFFFIGECVNERTKKSEVGRRRVCGGGRRGEATFYSG